MAQLNKTAYLNKYNGYFTSGQNQISGANLREFVQDTIDSIPFLLNDSQLMGLALYDPSRQYNTNSVTLFSGKLWIVTDVMTGTFDSLKTVALPISQSILELDDYSSTAEYAVGELVRHKWLMYRSLVSSNLGNDPKTSPTEWQLIETVNSAIVYDYEIGKHFRNTEPFYHNESVWKSPVGIFASDFDTEYSNGEIQHFNSLLKRIRKPVLYDDLSIINSTTMELIMDNILPPGAVPLTAKIKPIQKVSGSGIGTPTGELFMTNTYASNKVLISADLSVDTSSDGSFGLKNSTYNMIPDEITASALGIRISIPSGDVSSINQGEFIIYVHYLISQ
jgi:hypothetical protein